MKLREKIKRFWSLNVHNHEGFTLVELIIVIAILAILSSVAVVGYSSYVTKANMQADRTLAAEVANALTLYYYANSEKFADGYSAYVVLTPEGEVCLYDKADSANPGNLGLGNEAMIAAFGEGWEEALSLKYNGWVAEGAGDGTLINMDPEALTDAVSSLANLAAAASGNNKPNTIYNVLSEFCGLNEDQKAELASFKDDENYSTIATNLMIKYLADEISGTKVSYDENDSIIYVDSNGKEVSGGSKMALQYSMLYTMANTAGANQAWAKQQLTNFNDTLADISKREEENSSNTHVQAEIEAAWNALLYTPNESGMPFAVVYLDYMNTNADTEVSNMAAAMGAMSDLASGYSDAETLSNTNLFSGQAIVNAVKAYQMAAEYGGIVVQIASGECSIIPALN